MFHHHWGEFDFWMFTFFHPHRVEEVEADPVVKNRHFSISGTHEDAVGRDEGETGKGQVEGGGPLEKIYFWEGRCDGLEKVNSFLGGGNSKIFVFSSGSMER